MTEQTVSEQWKDKIQPYKMWVRFILMGILIINIGYNILEFKDNVRFSKEELGIIDYESNTNVYDLNINSLSTSSMDRFVKESYVDHELERDIAMMNIMFSLFIFILIRYGKGYQDD